MTASTVGAGWLLIGAALITLGVGVIRVACSSWAERRAVRDAAAEVRVRAALERLAVEADRDALALVIGLRRLDESVAPVIPIQRGASRWS